jgi:pyruvate dehydrogenase E1 component alpha subunit
MLPPAVLCILCVGLEGVLERGERVEKVQYLNVDGSEMQALPSIASDRSAVIGLYRAMTLTRLFDQKAVALQRTGRLGTYASSLGQEAVTVGVGAAMRSEDVFLPSFREQGAQLWRGVTMLEILQYWGGDERGSDFSGPREDFPVCVPVGSHAPQAAGVGLAFKLRGEQRVAVCVLGDGATSKGDFYEALNMVGVWSLPVVFVINNNQWAISVPRSEQSAIEALAEKGAACGVPGIQADGNDVFAMLSAMDGALEKARSGAPSIVEAITYRLSDHTTSDDARRYRDEAEVSRAWKQEPLIRLRAWLSAKDWWTREDEEALIASCQKDIDEAVAALEKVPPQHPSAMFEHLFAEVPAALYAQMEAAGGNTHE